MKILGLPSQVNNVGHQFRHSEFLIWISENKNLTIARLWASILSNRTSCKWLDYQTILQDKFEVLYLNFCKDKGYEVDEVMFDNKPDNTEVMNISNYRQNRAGNTKKETKWNVIESGEADRKNLIRARVNQTGEADSNGNLLVNKINFEVPGIVSKEEILRGGISESASPEF